ncbi:MAG: alkaline phosphatase family protein [Bdellovibrionales bacterium]|nr:alkaline phosphatase family protein [Bdellovibrionales bacterium]
MHKKLDVWSRRQFLATLFSAGAFAKAGTLAEPDSLLFPEQDKKGFSILQGMTDETSAQFTVVLPKKSVWTVQILDAHGQAAGTTSMRIVDRPFSNHAVYKLSVEGLRLGVNYRLRVLNFKGGIQDERDFATLDLSPRAVRLAFASCMCDHLHRDDVWWKFEQQEPEMAFFLGDSVYGDRPGFWTVRKADPEQLWNRYVATRNRVAFYFQRRLVPALATWDDHDFGGNNVYGNYRFKEDSRQVFETFFAQEERPSLQKGPGVARRFSAFGADFFLLDGRTYRDGWDGANSRVLGAVQEEWLFPAIRSKPTWLLNGSVFYGAYTGKDSFEGQYRNDFKAFIEKVKRSEGLVCFGSGDVHFSEIMDIEEAQLGYKTFEMVSSSMHSYTFPGHEWRFTNARRRVSTSSHNFTLYEGEFGTAEINGVISSFSAGSQEFRTPVRVKR